ncbi:MAG: DUF4364 family protein [Clostridia bacterium]|nr:DUF4364 family protein [Clostridia bacterium]
MAFFPEKQGRVKLLMLYIIKKYRTPISREQLYTALVNVSDISFFEMSELCAELEQEMYVVAVPARDQHLLYLTERGGELLDTFERELPRSERDEAAGYADDTRDRVRRDNCIVSDALPQGDGSWKLNLAILENENTLFEINLHMPDSHSAFIAQRQWYKEADDIYIGLLKRLSEEKE